VNTLAPHQHDTLGSVLIHSGNLESCRLEDAEGCTPCAELLTGSSLFSRDYELQGRSVMLALTSQLVATAALIELDGIARRVVLCPPDLSEEHFSYIIDTAEVDDVISDQKIVHPATPRRLCFYPCSRSRIPMDVEKPSCSATEWILLTSGTTGRPKLVVHTLASLTAAIHPVINRDAHVVWSTFYDIRRYGGLQILLRAALTGASMVFSDSDESVADFLARAASAGVTHISGTPSHWRRALMSPAAALLQPQYVRLSGEPVDQAILNHLREVYPHARIGHAFATTEAGVAFAVNDELAGFPAEAISGDPRVDMKIENETLRIRSNGTAQCYLGSDAPPLRDKDGFVDTKDIVELQDGRYQFKGRRDGVINVGGIKVHPEEVEAVISSHPEVQACLVHSRKSPITGALVVADVVLRGNSSNEERDLPAIREDILRHCRSSLPEYKVPVSVNVVAMLAIAASGKVMRQNA
jgi:acyl-CoA synthetase (AMP-forming)/AMP-acid ligase II